MDEADLSAVPLFPLPNVVLFPRAILPLHIFEERYKSMTADALCGPRQIAMALLRPGWENNYHGRAAVEPIVCVGTILTHERLTDGRYNFLLQGHTRARLMRERGEGPYRVAALKPLEETPVLEIDLSDERRRLAGVLDHPQLKQTDIGQKFIELLTGPLPTSHIADLIAFYFLDNLRLKQSLLAETNVGVRIGRVVEAFESLYSSMQLACPAHFCDEPSSN